MAGAESTFHYVHARLAARTPLPEMRLFGDGAKVAFVVQAGAQVANTALPGPLRFSVMGAETNRAFSTDQLLMDSGSGGLPDAPFIDGAIDMATDDGETFYALEAS